MRQKCQSHLTPAQAGHSIEILETAALSLTAATSEIAQAREWLRGASSVAVLTGAGVSAESGLPTFRGPNGLWRNHKPELLATPEAFAADPKLVWEWYDWRRSVHLKCHPNPGHHALAELEKRAVEFQLITQNVDSLHERAGSRRTVHLHGSVWRTRCMGCAEEKWDERVPLEPLPPHCECGAMLRPAVVWFGEPLPEFELRVAVEAARAAQVFVVVGTSSMVYPAAALPRLALESGARVIEVNPERTALTASAHIFLQGAAGQILPQLI